MTPTIAIPKLGPGLLRKYLGAQYVTALKNAGASVRWIGPDDTAAVKTCDGLLLPGGDDIDPKLYGQTPTEKCGKQNPLRDEIDPILLKTFLETGKPILGVCRGMQMMNVFCGGTLHQDIKDIQKIDHSQFRKLRKTCHSVSIAENSLLRRIVGSGEIAVNTLHHQAADIPGHGLQVSAVSPDGFAEAIELPDHQFFLGVQWHPEHLQHMDAHKKIITAFIEACKE